MLVEGLDYQVDGKDYDEEELQLLRDTYDTDVRNTEFEPLWHFLDVVFDEGARFPIFLNVEDIFCAVEDFCGHCKISDDRIPALYKRMFAVKHGFMTQAKMPWYMKDTWCARFKEPLKHRTYEDETFPRVLAEFVAYLDATKDVMKHQSTLTYMRVFVLRCGDEEWESDSEAL